MSNNQPFRVVIPARYASSRLPGKPLAKIAGKPMLAHVWERALQSGAVGVVIATDDARIEAAARDFGADVCMTAPTHASGTDRIAEVADRLRWSDDSIIVNLQGDEPLMPASLVRQCASLLGDSAADMSTLASPFESRAEFDDPNNVKVLVDRHGFAIYFSRAALPYGRDDNVEPPPHRCALLHHGIYGYRVSVLKHLVASPQSALERCECLEQLRALENGMRIRVAVPDERPGPSVDTAADLEAVGRILTSS